MSQSRIASRSEPPFGTVCSSLAHMNQLPIDRIKIDRSFVHGLPGNAGNAAIARAIVMRAQSLGREVIAEGVEAEAQPGAPFK